MVKNVYDVIIIGGGVVGSAVARELSRFELKIGLLEKNHDVINEMSGRNSGVAHAGFSYEKGTLKAKYSVIGNREMEKASQELDFSFNRTGKLLVGNTEEEYKSLLETKAHGEENGVEGLDMVDGDELKNILPYAKGKFALYSKMSGILDPFEFTIGLAENAVQNGVDYHLKNEVQAINFLEEEKVYEIRTNRGLYYSKWIINSAGIGANSIAQMMGIKKYPIESTRGTYYVLDKRTGPMLTKPLYPVPSTLYMGIHLTPTVDGNILIGPDAERISDSKDYSVNKENMDYLIEEANKLWPHIKPSQYIRNYAGIQTTWADSYEGKKDFLIEIREESPQAIQMIGMESPALTCALPIARHVRDLLAEHIDLKEKKDFNPIRKSPKRFIKMSDREKEELIKENPAYGEIVCRCEEVTKGEILEAINNPLGADDVVGVKYRTRAMMGRCQGGYCLTRICQMIQEEKGLKEEEILYDRDGSYMFCGKVRD